MQQVVYGLAVAVCAFITSSPLIADDGRIAQEIAARLRAQQGARQLQDFHIELKVEDGKVWVQGQVAQPQHGNLALDVTRRVPGVKLVINQLQIGQPAPVARQGSRNVGRSGHVRHATTTQAGWTDIMVKPASAVSRTQLGGTPLPAASTFEAIGSGLARPGFSVRPPTINPPSAAAAPVFNNYRQAETGAPPQIRRSTPASVLNSPQAISRPFVSQPISASTVPPQAVAPPTIMSPRVVSTPIQPGASTYPRIPASPPVGQGLVSPARPLPQSTISAGPPRPIRLSRRTQAARGARNSSPVPVSDYVSGVGYGLGGHGSTPIVSDVPNVPNSAWPSYAAYPNYGAVTYPQQYSPTAWPYIGPFYPYPQVPLGWRKVTLEWDDGWWFLDFKSK